jgi:hypothetical protein
LADVGLYTFLRADVDNQLAVKPAGDLPTDYARPFLVLMKSEHHVPCGRNAGLGIGIDFVELHWEDRSAARSGMDGIDLQSSVTSFRNRERAAAAYLVVSLTNAAMIC